MIIVDYFLYCSTLLDGCFDDRLFCITLIIQIVRNSCQFYFSLFFIINNIEWL